MAANSSPPILPISVSTAAGDQPVPSESSVRSFISGIAETVRTGLSNRRPWGELLDRGAFSKPESLAEGGARIRKNYAYFRINYITVVAGVVAISLLTNPLSLIFLFGLLAAWLFLYIFRRPSDPPISLFGREYSDRETLIFLILSSIVVIFLTNVGSVVISALLVGVGLVCAHGAFRVPEDLFLDEAEPQTGVPGILSLLTGSAVAVSQPARA
ncbi:hypothetical protein M569_11668 [Genlisea aurea]|uniref:PRA1 family protein n=1 Tax=Genlisea aurea TaxID=192259 RepID=S8C8D1_9LAMI|nr:hypothetical protein M569_11668 [Genlisea aurea]